MDVAEKVTVVMTTFNQWDFTHASVRSIRDYYPDVRIILADGGSRFIRTRVISALTHPEQRPVEIICLPKFPIEDCRNAAATLVETPYVLFCDNDVKCLGEGCIEPMVEVLEWAPEIVQTGAYALKVINREKMVGTVGKDFREFIDVDACPAYWSLHDREAFMAVGGMPKEQLFYPMPDHIVRHMKTKLTGYGGDFSVSVRYQENAWRIVTPRERIPLLHWGGRFRFNKGQKTTFENWWLRESTHLRVEPFTKSNIQVTAESWYLGQ